MIALDGRSLTLADVVAVARHRAPVSAAPAAVDRVRASRAAVERAIARGDTMYGVNTGFGKLANVRIPPDKLQDLQRNLIRSHASGVGDPLPAEAVRAMMLLRANVLLMGTSGARAELPLLLVELLNRGIHPSIRSQGSGGRRATWPRCPIWHSP